MRPIDIAPADLETIRRILSEHASNLEVCALSAREYPGPHGRHPISTLP